jgi:hypothetical protein
VSLRLAQLQRSNSAKYEKELENNDSVKSQLLEATAIIFTLIFASSAVLIAVSGCREARHTLHQGPKVRHLPPPPLGRPYPNSRAITSRKTLLSLTQFEYCLSAPPLGGFTNDQDASSFTVVEELDLRDGRGAQIV